MKTSKVKGCFWSLSHRVWFARTRGKRVLYRGLDQTEAEKARLSYDKRLETDRHSAGRNLMSRLNNVMQPTWIAGKSPANYFENEYGR